MKHKQYEGSLFGGTKKNKEKKGSDIYASVNVERLIIAQADLLMQKYNTACLDVKQLKEILNVGESNVYELLNTNSFPTETIGRRKVVPAIALAAYLVLGCDARCKQSS
jgi:predicted DNA-binding transcriptional regulator AlpA